MKDSIHTCVKNEEDIYMEDLQRNVGNDLQLNHYFITSDKINGFIYAK